jgi:riboflavin kinase/FMN adenylyltransferase
VLHVVSLNGAHAGSQPSAVCIGNFDGVHAGHQALIAQVVRLSKNLGVVPAALTFDPHPSVVIAPDRAPKLLTTIEQRAKLMRHLGIEQVFLLPFDRELAQTSPETFAKRILREEVAARAVVVGEDFRFGHRQAGTVTLLRQLGQSMGFEVHAIGKVEIRGRLVSSTEIRNLIQAGQVSRACRLLRRPYSVCGEVVSGLGIGSKQTVPTLNLETASEVLPARGVYISRTHEVGTGRNWESITNVGYRPTFGGDRLTIETYLLSEFDGNRPASIELDFLRRVRDERRFESAEELKTQILKDVASAKSYFRRSMRLGGIETLC